jgi:hypothetical protein
MIRPTIQLSSRVVGVTPDAGTTLNGDERVPLLIGLLFRVIVVAGGVFFHLHQEQADVFLYVTGAPNALQGRVVYQGVPADGVLPVRVAGAWSQQLTYSATVDVKDGVL